MLSEDFLDTFYSEYPKLEDAFMAELDVSLKPRSRDLRYDVVARLGLQPLSTVLDVGCGEGRHAFELARRFGFSVHGTDPVPRHIELCNAALTELRTAHPEAAARVRFDLGRITDLAEEAESTDLVWAYDIFEHIDETAAAFSECFRVLRRGGYMLVYSQFATDRLEPREAQFLFATMGLTATSADAQDLERACTAAGFTTIEKIELKSEYEERSEEDAASVGRHLLHAARLLRSPETYREKFGQAAYDIKLGDCLWHIYPMIGKLSPRIYLLQRP